MTVLFSEGLLSVFLISSYSSTIFAIQERDTYVFLYCKIYRVDLMIYVSGSIAKPQISYATTFIQDSNHIWMD